MCVETMDIKPKPMKPVKPDCLRKTAKPGSDVRWPEGRGALLRTGRAARKCLRRRARLAGPAGKERREPLYEPRLPAAAAWAACDRHRPAGSMAPENTTQYLMSHAYEDMAADVQAAPQGAASTASLHSDCPSPGSVYAALDCGYEACLDFQQRDFERFMVHVAL